MSDDIETFAESLSKQQLACRTSGHGSNMAPWTVTKGKAEGHPSAYYHVVFRCKCRVKRVLWLTRKAHVISSHYDYTSSPGYLSEQGRITGEDRDVLRLVQITSALEPK